MNRLRLMLRAEEFSSIIIELSVFVYDLFIHKPFMLFLNCLYPIQREYFFHHLYTSTIWLYTSGRIFTSQAVRLENRL
jgi:hypothetical protein